MLVHSPCIFLCLGELDSNQRFAFGEMTLLIAGWFDVTVEMKLVCLRRLPDLILTVDEQIKKRDLGSLTGACTNP